MANKMYANDPQASRYQKPRRASIFDSEKTGRRSADFYTGKKVKAKAKSQVPIQQPNKYSDYDQRQSLKDAERQMKLYKNKEGYPTFATKNEREA
jgi:hypothetical protein